MDISKIEAATDLADKTKDKYLLELLSKAYKGEILCQMALIKMEAIKPLTDYQPEIDKYFQNYFVKQANKEEHIPLFVYQKDGQFIMSDDYNAYALYEKFGFENVPCVVIGEITDMKNVVDIGKPFQLEKQKFEVINK